MQWKGWGWEYAREAVIACGIVVACVAWRIMAGEHPVPVATNARLYRIVIPLTALPAGPAESQP